MNPQKMELKEISQIMTKQNFAALIIYKLARFKDRKCLESQNKSIFISKQFQSIIARNLSLIQI